MSELVDLGLRFRGSSTNIRPEGVTVHYGGPSPWGSADRSSGPAFRDSVDHTRCPSIVRAWHDYHLSKGWYGLAYTSCECPHGVRYEGRGPGKRTGANGTNPGNLRSYAVVYLGGVGDPLTDEAKRAFHDEAARLGVPLRWCHSDWKATACPGNILRSWRDTGWPAPGGSTPPTPAPTLTPPPAGGDDYDMDYLDLSKVTSKRSTWVTGRHVDNLQALMLTILKFVGREDMVPALLGPDGVPDGIAGPGTAAALEVAQETCLYFGMNIGAAKADRKCGAATWRAIIEF